MRSSRLVSPAEAADPPRLRRVIRSFGFAAEGVWMMLRTQPNFVIHLCAALLALALGALLRLSAVEFGLIIAIIVLVLIVECVNTALETLCDLASPGFHPLVKRVKDISAAAVLIGALGAVAIAMVVYIPHLAGMLK